jgi:alpha-L-fucosidase
MVYYTRKGATVYAICLAWPGKTLKLEVPITTPDSVVRMLGRAKPLVWKAAEKGLVIQTSEIDVGDLPCRNAWVFKLTGLRTAD